MSDVQQEIVALEVTAKASSKTSLHHKGTHLRSDMTQTLQNKCIWRQTC